MSQQPSKPGWPYGSEINYYQQPLYNIPYSPPVKCMDSCCQPIRVPAPRRPYQHLPYFQQESVNHYPDSRPKQPVPNYIPINHYWPQNCQPQYQHPPLIHRPIPQSKCDYKDFYKINKHRFQPYPNNSINIEPIEKRPPFAYPPEKSQKKTGELDVRQFLATWQEKDDDNAEPTEVVDIQHEVRPPVPPKEVFQPLDCTKRNEGYKRIGKYFRDPNYMAHHGTADKQTFHDKGFVQHPKYEFSFPDNYNVTSENNGYSMQYKNYPDSNMPKGIAPDGSPIMINHSNKLYENCNMGSNNYNDNYPKDCHKTWGSLPCERRIDKIFNPIAYSMTPHSVNIHQNKSYDKNCTVIPPNYTIDTNDPYLNYKPGNERNQYNLATCLENDELFDDINNRKDVAIKEVEQVSCYNKNICIEPLGQLASGPEIMANITQNSISVEQIQQEHIIPSWEHATPPTNVKSDVSELLNLTPCPSESYSLENQLDKTSDKCVLLEFSEAAPLKEIPKVNSNISLSENCEFPTPSSAIVPSQEENSYNDCPIFSSISSSNELTVLNECEIITVPKTMTGLNETSNETPTLTNNSSSCSLNEVQVDPQNPNFPLVKATSSESDDTNDTASEPSSGIDHLISSQKTDVVDKTGDEGCADLDPLSVEFLNDKPEPSKNVSDQISSLESELEPAGTIEEPSLHNKKKLLAVTDAKEYHPDTSINKVNGNIASCDSSIPSPPHVSNSGVLETSNTNGNILNMIYFDSMNASEKFQSRNPSGKEQLTRVPQIQNALESIALMYNDNPSSASSEEVNDNVLNSDGDLKSPAGSITPPEVGEWAITKFGDKCIDQDINTNSLEIDNKTCDISKPEIKTRQHDLEKNNMTLSASNDCTHHIPFIQQDLLCQGDLNSPVLESHLDFTDKNANATSIILPEPVNEDVAVKELTFPLSSAQEKDITLNSAYKKKLNWLKPNKHFSKVLCIFRNLRMYIAFKHSKRSLAFSKKHKKKPTSAHEFKCISGIKPNISVVSCEGNMELGKEKSKESPQYLTEELLPCLYTNAEELEGCPTSNVGNSEMPLHSLTGKESSVENSAPKDSETSDNIELQNDLIKEILKSPLGEADMCKEQERKDSLFILLDEVAPKMGDTLLERVLPERSVTSLEGVTPERCVTEKKGCYSNLNLECDVDSSGVMPSMLGHHQPLKDNDCENNSDAQSINVECEVINDTVLPDVDNWPYLEEEVQTVPDNINIKCSLSWEKIFNSKLKKKKDSKKAEASLELGPAKVEVRLSPEVCKGQWKIMEGNKDVNSSIVKVKRIILKRKSVEESVPKVVIKKTNHEYKSYIKETKYQPRVLLERSSELDLLAQRETAALTSLPKFKCDDCSAVFNAQRGLLTHKCKSREVHHCVLCHESFLNQASLLHHQDSQSHRHLEIIQRNAIHSVYKLLTGDDCPFFSPLSNEDQEHIAWHPDFPGYNHYYHHVPL